MNLSTLLIYGLASWRISSFLVLEEGPFHVFEKLRFWAGIQHEGIVPDNLIGGILSCTWCCSIWIALFWMILFLLIPGMALIIALPFSISAVAILCDTYIQQGRR